MSEGPSLKPLVWVGSSHEDLRDFPEPAQDRMGYALYVTQRGGKHRDSKPLSGFGRAGVLEVIEDFGAGAMSGKRYETGSGNVFQDIGVPNPEEHLVKAQLVFRIDGIIKKRRLKQVEAADLLGIRQPDVSKMLRGDFRQFSVERLMRFLVALNQDVEIVVKPHRGRGNAPALHVS